MQPLKLINGSAIAAILAIASAVGFTIGAEFSPALKTWLTNLSGHHWVSKSLITIIVYLIGLGAVLARTGESRATTVRKNLLRLGWVGSVATIAIVAFFVWHYLSA